MKTKLNKILFLLIIFALSGTFASASERAALSGCGIQSVELPDGAKTATRDMKPDNPLLSMLNTDSETLYNNMVAGNTYLISFLINESQAVQYVIMSTDNSGIEGGSLNAVSGEQLNTVAAQIGKAVASDGASRVSSYAPVTLANGNFVEISGSLPDESNGTTLYFQTYGTVQSGKLIFIRALNYTGNEFTPEQLEAVKQVAESAVFEPYSPKPSKAPESGTEASTPKPEASAPAAVTEQPAPAEASEAAPAAKTAETAEPAENETEEDNLPDDGQQKNRGIAWLYMVVGLIVIIIPFAIVYFRERKR